MKIVCKCKGRNQTFYLKEPVRNDTNTWYIWLNHTQSKKQKHVQYTVILHTVTLTHVFGSVSAHMCTDTNTNVDCKHISLRIQKSENVNAPTLP